MIVNNRRLIVNNLSAVAQFVFGIIFAVVCAAGVIRADELHPFRALDSAAASADLTDPADLRRLMHRARELTLHGAARKYARQLIALQPNDAEARALVWQKSFLHEPTRQLVWLDWFEAEMWQNHRRTRDVNLGYVLHTDRELAARGKLRLRDGEVVSVAYWDEQHAEWQQAYEVYSRFYRLRASLPLAAVWFVADDLDRLTFAYLDYFEIERLPSERFTTHLYRTADESAAAGADATMLKKYGAYYDPRTKILHVSFTSLGGLTAVRHEAAHALNREFVNPNPPQWFDEGVGVLCQFALPQANGDFVFGRFPRHGFGVKFVETVNAGGRERALAVHQAPHVVTNAEYYSKFRALVAFLMDDDDRARRFAFLKTMFRRQGEIELLLQAGDFDAVWMRYVQALRHEPDFPYLPLPHERADQMQRVLKAGTSSVLFAAPLKSAP